jgi:hypothetical protein
MGLSEFLELPDLFVGAPLEFILRGGFRDDEK